VLGDYDIDGVCSAYLLKQAIKDCGGSVDSTLPHRIKDGYGLNDKLIFDAQSDGIDTIITCDNGISAIEPITYAKELGMTVIITDHHEIPFQYFMEKKEYLYPNADAIVNPKQEDCLYPFKGLCGAGVVFKLMQILYQKVSMEGREREYIDMVAFATIGDVMELRGENRILVKFGLKQLLHTKNIGMKALIKACGLEKKSVITPYYVGFLLGPCLNATGRLESAMKALRLLEEEDEKQADILALELKSINDLRKEMTEEHLSQAIAIVESGIYHNDKVLVIYLKDCHESLAGIIAGRLRERYQKPVFVLTNGEESVKGSGRSVEAYSMYEEMTKCKELFVHFGGHKMAAGLSIVEDQVEQFRQQLNRNAALTDDDLQEKVMIDMALPFSMITESLVEEIALLEPCGTGNRRAQFATREVTFEQGKTVGKYGNIYKCIVKDLSGRRLDGIYFGDIGELREYIGKKPSVNITFYPEINEYLNKRTIQIMIQKYQ
jgi:single-stranded-DNA-specific exonuclease